MRGPAALLLTLLAACAPDAPGPAGRGRGAETVDRVCAAPDRCVVAHALGPVRAEVLIVVLHGDVGGPADYGRLVARQVSAALPDAAVAFLVRPGYADGAGRASDGDRQDRAGSAARLAEAITALRARTGARRVVAWGHSGGAGAAVALLEAHPGTLDGAALLACSCRGAAARVGRVRGTPSVFAFTGTADTGSPPSSAIPYVEALAARGLPARFVPVPGATHDTVVTEAWRAGLAEALAMMAR